MPAEAGTLTWRSATRRSAQWARILPALVMAGSRGAAVALQFLVQVAVGSLAGPAGLGVLQLFMSWTCILGEISALGLPARAMRVISVAWSQGDVGAAREELHRDAAWILKASAGIVIAAGLLFTLVSLLGGTASFTEVGLILIATVLAAPLFALLRLAADALKATNAALAAITLENLVAPAVLLACALVCWQMEYALTGALLLLAALAGFAASAFCLWRALYRRFTQLPRRVATAAATPAIKGDLLALWGTAVLGIGFLHLPFLVLPVYVNTAEIGTYAVAHKLVNIVTTLLILLSAVFGPAFARAAAAGDRDKLRALLYRTQLLSVAIFVPLTLLLLIGTAPLAALFNVPTGALEVFLLALVAGQLVNAATGLPGVLLNMSGAARWELLALVMTIIFTLLAAPWVGGSFGAVGLAWLFAAALAVKNLVSYGLAIIYLGRIGRER